MPPLKIALVGGGLGGVTFAAVLKKELEKHDNRELELAIYEGAPDFTIAGAAIGMGTNAESIFDYLGLAKECTKLIRISLVLSEWCLLPQSLKSVLR